MRRVTTSNRRPHLLGKEEPNKIGILHRVWLPVVP
jgi:hypothetical protein